MGPKSVILSAWWIHFELEDTTIYYTEGRTLV